MQPAAIWSSLVPSAFVTHPWREHAHIIRIGGDVVTIRPRPGDLEAASKPHPFVPSAEYAVQEPCDLCGFARGHTLMHPDESDQP